MNKEIISLLKRLVLLLEIKEENPFKINAYRNAAEYLESSAESIEELVKLDKLKEIKGFGKALQEKITEYVQFGKISFYEKLIEEVPESLAELNKIKGLGPKKIKLLWKELGITSIDLLEEACINNEIIKLKGFTAKTQEEIFNSLSHLKASKGKFLQDRNSNIIEQLIKELDDSKEITKAEAVGELRRFSEVISEIKIIAESKTIKEISENVQPLIKQMNSSGVKAEIIFSKPEDYYSLLHYNTGNNEYLSAFENYITLNNYELREGIIFQDGHKVRFSSEEEVFSRFNLQYIPPELRESASLIELAANNNIPKLIEEKDLIGMLHIHTNWSDGRNTVEEMALQAKALGFEYIAVCDHSKYAAYANGLTEERVLAQFNEIDKLNAKGLGIRILKGIESDILPDGSLDYSPEFLEQFDLVVASIHSNFRMNKSEMTKRIIKAVENPYSHIIGHPTGRLLLTRAGYEIDIDEFISAAAHYGKVIEINANPYRLDLPWRDAIKAREKGVKFAINPDSHKKETLSDVYIGLKAARKAGLTKEDVINTYSLERFYRDVVKKTLI